MKSRHPPLHRLWRIAFWVFPLLPVLFALLLPAGAEA